LDVKIAEAIECEHWKEVFIVATKVGGIHERRTITAQLGSKSVYHAFATGRTSGLEGTRRDGEVRRKGLAGYISVAGWIDGYSFTTIIVVPAQIRRIDDSVTPRIELRYENVRGDAC